MTNSELEKENRENPFFVSYNTPHDTVPFNRIKTSDYEEAFKSADYIIIATPTNYDDELNYFDTSSVEDIIEKVIG